MKKDIFVSAVVPISNSAHSLKLAFEKLNSVLHQNYNYFEIIFIDDGSTDESSIIISEILKNYNSIRYIRLSRSYGLDLAISAGLNSAIGDYTIVLDPLIDPADIIPELVMKCQKEPGVYYGVVDKNFYSKKNKFFRIIFSSFFEWYCLKFLKIDIQRKSLIFRVFSRQALNIFNQTVDKAKILRYMTANIGLKTYKFDYTPLSTKGLITSRNFSDDINLAFDILVSTSRQPLRLVSRLGICLAACNFFYTFYILGVFIFKSSVAEGWVTQSLQTSIMFFFLFVVLALIGEYVGKIAFETSHKNSYTVLEEVNSSVLINENIRTNVTKET